MYNIYIVFHNHLIDTIVKLNQFIVYLFYFCMILDFKRVFNYEPISPNNLFLHTHGKSPIESYKQEHQKLIFQFDVSVFGARVRTRLHRPMAQ